MKIKSVGRNTVLRVDLGEGDQRAASARLTALVYQNVPLTQSVTLVLAGLLTCISYPERPKTVIVWFSVMFCISLMRAFLALQYRRTNNKDLAVWRTKAVFAALASGFGWALGVLIMTWHTSTALAMFVPFILAGAVAGAVTTLASVPGAFLAFATPPLLTLASVNAIASVFPFWEYFVSAVILFFLGMLVCARRFHEQIRKVLLLEAYHANQASMYELARDAALIATNAKIDFLAMVSHEIRTPMNGIVGMTSLLVESELTKDQTQMTTVICASARTLLDIVNDLLDVAKMDNSVLSVEWRPFRIRPLLQEMLHSALQEAEAKQIFLTLSVPDSVPNALIGDAVKVRKVLKHLLSNAVKFTDRGGVEIKISANRLEGRFVSLKVEVVDSGIGIPPNSEGQLFKPFAQIDPSRTRRHDGAGLGLMICKRFVEAMGGVIGYHSTLGKGSTFSFSVALEVVAEE